MDTYQTELKTVKIHARCEACKEGEVELMAEKPHSSLAKLVDGEKLVMFRHECNKCHAEHWIAGETYPHIEYIEMPQALKVTQIQ